MYIFSPMQLCHEGIIELLIRMRSINHYDIKGHQHEVHLTTIIYACLLYQSGTRIITISAPHFGDLL